MIVRKALEEDTLQLQRLLSKAGVIEQVYDEEPTEFIVAENENAELVATAGLAGIGKKDVILRSLVIDSEKVGAVFLLEFLETATAFAEKRGYKSLYLLTSGQQAFLEQVGFSLLQSDEVPKRVRESNHYKQNVKRSPKVMHTRLAVNK
ncbi:GNAT family N-acetyltransferase [Alteribacter keqinensis]|uniref:N-acetyltransferase domain-containing protein n=2 Tax=Alteribacter TaxID=2823237 RepID=A0A3M7TRD4_9BACI|nr:hypothetical protein [Alteribacter keqinensis]RNA67827.1 hypothetical protein EBO34_14075 [Alteribacter keqinensis]